MMMMATVYIVIEVCICEFCEHCIEMKRQRRHYDNDDFTAETNLLQIFNIYLVAGGSIFREKSRHG
jgi:hypothetical protein